MSEKNTPDLKTMMDNLTDTITDAAYYRDNCANNYNIRFALWNGQSDDGRKWKSVIGKDAFPWDGASDTRIRLGDKIINETVAMQIEAFFRCTVQASAMETSDLPTSSAVTTLLKWVKQSMGKGLRNQLELLGQWRGQSGAAALGIFWNRELRMRSVEITLEKLKQMGDEMLANGDKRGQNFILFLEMLHDPVQEQALVEMIRSMSDYMDRSEAKKILRELQTTGKAEVPVPYVFKNAPEWRALRLMVDVIFPYSAELDLQRAPWVAQRVWMTPEALEAKIDEEGWDEDFVMAAKEKTGISSIDDQIVNAGRNHNISIETERHENEVEIIHYYTHTIRNGVLEMSRTILHGSIPELCGIHETSPFKHGKYPCIISMREVIDSVILESRGVPEIVATQQHEIKVQRDSRTDRTSLATLPPMKVPPSRADKLEVYGPGSRIPTRHNDTTEFMRPPTMDPGSSEIERTTERDANEYFGRGIDGVDPVMAGTLRQKQVNDFLADMTDALVMTFQLMRQYMSAEEVQRIVGVPIPWDGDEIEIQGLFDFVLAFDVRDLDTEYVAKKMKLLGEIMSMDGAGIIDRNNLVKFAVAAVDPTLAGMIVRDVGAVTGQEIEDEKQQVSLALNGIQPPMNPGQNYQLRLQTLMQTINNPQIAATLEQRELSRKLIEERVQFFKQQLVQDENKVIGRLGVRPSLGLPAQ